MKSLICGTIVGIVFSVAKMPVPAPPTIEGIMGIVGMFLGFTFMNYILGVINDLY